MTEIILGTVNDPVRQCRPGLGDTQLFPSLLPAALMADHSDTSGASPMQQRIRRHNFPESMVPEQEL